MSEARRQRWQRLGRLGQLKYGQIACTTIAEDETLGKNTRKLARIIRYDLDRLETLYRSNLNAPRSND